MSILIVYDGWATLTFGGVAAVIVGPMLCIFLGHVFGAGMGMRVEQGRPLNRAERREILTVESRFLLLLVPPLAILCVLWAFGVDYTEIIQTIVAVGVLSLGFWGGVAGRRAHLTGWSFVLSVAYGLLMGSVILVLQAILRPGEVTLHTLTALAGS